MATRSSDFQPVSGRVDAAGRLVKADPELAALQRDAGSSLGAPLAIPQLAAIARMARKLNISVSRRAVAAAPAQDVDMWVRAVPDGDEVALTIERWSARPATSARLDTAGADDLASHGTHRWAVDGELRIVSISPGAADLIGAPPAEASGQLLTKLIKLEENQSGEIPMLHALASRTGFDAQPCRRRSDDSPLTLSGEVALTASDAFAGFEGSIELADGPAASGNPAKSDPAFNELLRTPLRRIIEGAGQIAERSDGPIRDEYADYAADISAAARHLLSVVHSMGEEVSSRHSTIDLVELVYEAVGLMESAATEREIAVAIQPLPTFTAKGDARGVIQILVNLVGNAVRHSSSRATVAISFEPAAGHSIVHVADDGPGIAPEDQRRIFERFEQGKGSDGGSGLGLAIARRLARGMGGDIQLESQPGTGSRFSLVLPAA